MPLDRSPVTAPATATVPVYEEDMDLRQQQATASQPLCFTGDNQRLQGQSHEIHSNEFRLLKLPNFWHKQPKLWFAQLESEFSLYRIRSDDIKYSSVIRHLDEQALVAISEIIESPPEKDKYLHVKNLLINRFTDSEEKRLRQLLAGIELNGKKPSDLLREIKQLAGGAISDNILHSIWLQRLPYQVQATLAVVEDSPLIKLAELADKILERDNCLQVATIASSEDKKASKVSSLADLEKRIAALEVRRPRSKSKFRYKEKRFRSSSRHKNDNKNNKETKNICFYHKKFGAKAYKCTIPCDMSKSIAEKEN